jgi:hypothetical protein
MNKETARRISHLERSPALRRIYTPKDSYPWLDAFGEAKIARATLDAIETFCQVIDDAEAAGNAMVFLVDEVAEKLKLDLSYEPLWLSEFGEVRADAIPTINRVLDAVNFNGPRHFPQSIGGY